MPWQGKLILYLTEGHQHVRWSVNWPDCNADEWFKWRWLMTDETSSAQCTSCIIYIKCTMCTVLCMMIFYLFIWKHQIKYTGLHNRSTCRACHFKMFQFPVFYMSGMCVSFSLSSGTSFIKLFSEFWK